MAGKVSSSSWVTGSYRAAYLMSFPIIAFVALRKMTGSEDALSLVIALGLLSAYLLLLLSRGFITNRIEVYRHLYFLLQSVIILALGLLRPYEDTWAMLYIPLSFQLIHECSRKVALAWGTFFAVSILVILVYTSGWISGIGFSLLYIAVGIFFCAYDYQYSRSEAARQESQVLLEELRVAHAKLEEHAAHVDETASIQEHEQIARQLHESVSQIIFSISLDAQSARLMVDKDPRGVPPLLDRLQEQTATALAQMRALITQWRMG
ncbi:MAG: histidine kinase [Anaerolineales bacterium]